MFFVDRQLWYNGNVPVYDITLPISERLPVWPGDPPVSISRLDSGREEGSDAAAPAVSSVCLSSHAGTHVDPPAHFFPGAVTVDRLPLDRLIGPAWVAHVAGSGPVRAGMLAGAGIPAGTRRLLLRTANAERMPSSGFASDFVALGLEAAQWVLDQGIDLIGIDGPSIEPYDSPGDPVHRLLLAAGVIIVENLALAGIQPGAYQVYCLPLLIADGDGAPARVVLLREA
jgi:arylformamidase